MIKSLIILVLVGVLALGTFLSKPSSDSFAAFMKTQNQPAPQQSMVTSILGGLIGQAKAALPTYSDHVFWATEDLNGQPLYIGMFGHWWKKSAATATTSTPAIPPAS